MTAWQLLEYFRVLALFLLDNIENFTNASTKISHKQYLLPNLTEFVLVSFVSSPWHAEMGGKSNHSLRPRDWVSCVVWYLRYLTFVINYFERIAAGLTPQLSTRACSSFLERSVTCHKRFSWATYVFSPNMIRIIVVVTNVLHNIKGHKAIWEHPNRTLPAMFNKLSCVILLEVRARKGALARMSPGALGTRTMTGECRCYFIF